MDKNVIIFMNAIRPATFDALAEYKKVSGRVFELVVFVDKNIKLQILNRNAQNNQLNKASYIDVDFDDYTDIQAALETYRGRIFSVVSQYENSMTELQKIIPHITEIDMPTPESIMWSTEKKFMREKVGLVDRSLVPQHVEFHTDEKYSPDKFKHLQFPVIVKPSGLEGSLLVTKVKSAEELGPVISQTLAIIQRAYDTWIKRQKPFLLIEEFMSGEMYSVDVYVNHEGIGTFLPFVKVETGYSVGKEDFYGYTQTTPPDLTPSEIVCGKEASQSIINALNLRSTTAHVELMKTSDGWKLIEIAPRIGGYRHYLYSRSYRINHIMNDILIRAAEPVIAAPEFAGYSCTMKVYADQEGTIKQILGLDLLGKCKEIISIKQNLFENDEAIFARNNGDPIFEIELFALESEDIQKAVSNIESTVKFLF